MSILTLMENTRMRMFMKDAGDGGAPPAGGGTEPPADPSAGLDGDDDLAGGSLVGNDPPDDPQTPTDPPSKDDKPVELTDEQWLDGIKFTEDMGKDAEGNAISVNKEAVKAFMPALREVGLSPEQASKLATHYAKMERDGLAKIQEQMKKENEEHIEKLKAQRDELAKQSKEQLSEDDFVYANRAMAQFKTTDPKFYKVVQTSMLGVHPTFLKILATAGRNMGDDSLPKPAGMGGGAQKSPAQILFSRQISAGLMNP